MRYPGGKNKVSKVIVPYIKRFYYENECKNTCIYVEPFWGSGSIGLKLLSDNVISKIAINDYDIGIACFWTAVLREPNELCRMIDKFKPSSFEFYRIKNKFSEKRIRHKITEENYVQIGFEKLAIHQISYSGLGVKSGGPLGGREQTSKYKIDCRWNPKYLKNKIKKYSNLFSKVKIEKKVCGSYSFELVFKEFQNSETFYYLDPPYYKTGSQLYQYYFTETEHINLSKILKKMKQPWLLSYDVTDEIKEIYNWAVIIEFSLKYTISTSRSRRELLICSPDFKTLLGPLEEDIFNNK